jgi:hypothetical protein
MMVPGHKLPRLDPGGQAPTLRAGTGAERGSHTAPRPVHPHVPRVITVREAARLHGYPDWFCFYPGKWHAYRQIGNSVCPPVARALGLALMRALGVDPAQLPRPALALGPVPVVAGGGPPAPRRLQTAAEFPKVVEALWRAATAQGLPPVAAITVDDVEAAIAASGAALPRVRPARFVSALLRFRRAEALLELPRAAGFTLAAGGAGRVGSWVSLAEAAARRAPAPVRSAALRGARPLPVPGGAASAGARAALAAHPEVCAALGLGALALGAPPAGEGSGPWPAVADGAPAGVLALGHGRLPPLRALATVAARAGCAELVLIAPLTAVHVLAARFRCAGGVAEEVSRAVFSLRPGD